MNVIQKQILFYLKERNKLTSISSVAASLNKNLQVILMEMDLLERESFIETQRAGSKKTIKRAKITDKGITFFYDGNKITNPNLIQKQIDELRNAVDVLNKALNAPTREEGMSMLSKSEKVFNILNGAYQTFENVMHFVSKK